MHGKENSLVSITPQPATGYVANVTSRRLTDPVLLFEQGPLSEDLKTLGGATGISVADILKSFQFHSELYFGATSPGACTEVPHWHTDQLEAYVMINGEADIQAKRRWVANGWLTTSAKAGDVMLVQPEVCHWFRWRSDSGLCYVFKAPQRAGLGAFPAGKVTCDRGCPEKMNGCVCPIGYTW